MLLYYDSKIKQCQMSGQQGLTALLTAWHNAM